MNGAQALTATGRLIGLARSYDELHDALRARCDELAVSRLDLDDISGMPSGYCAKLLGPAKMKRLGMLSLGPVLQALGLKLAIIEDPDAIEKMRPRLGRRRGSQAHSGDAHWRYAKRGAQC